MKRLLHSILFTAVPKPKIDFVREVLTKTTERPSDIASIDDIILMSDSISSFNKHVSNNMTSGTIKKIENMTHGQNKNEVWYQFRKGVITAPKCHDVHTKMVKVNKGHSNVDMWPLHQKISGLVFTNPDIPALKYSRVMEDDAANCFTEIMKKKHKNFQLHECGLYLHNKVPYIGGSPDQIVTCSCCKPACLEIKCPYSINHLSPHDSEASDLSSERKR